MYQPAARLAQLRHLLTILVVVAIVGGSAMIGLGAVRLDRPEGLWLIVVGAGTVLASVFALIIVFIMLKMDSNIARVSTAIRDLYEEVERYGHKLDAIADSTCLSDAAKSIAHRLEDRAALRAAIYSEIAMNDWEAAIALIDDMERRFGYKEEAQQLREQVNRACRKFYQEEVDKALPVIERLFQAHEWVRADQEIGRLLAAFPNEPRFSALREELARRKEARKNELVKAFTEGARREEMDPDDGMAILRELDEYLTREEASQLESAAREVVKGKLLQLGMRFQFAVKEQRWRDALEVGVAISEEFPNSRMASEVEARIGVLRARAGIPADVEVSTSLKNKTNA